MGAGKGLMMIMFKNIILKHQPEHFSGRRGSLQRRKVLQGTSFTLRRCRLRSPLPSRSPSRMHKVTSACFSPGDTIASQVRGCVMKKITWNAENYRKISITRTLVVYKGYSKTVARRQPLHLEACEEPLEVVQTSRARGTKPAASQTRRPAVPSH